MRKQLKSSHQECVIEVGPGHKAAGVYDCAAGAIEEGLRVA